MTPEKFARNLAASDRAEDRALGVAMIYRALTDNDPADPLRMPWPETNETIERAATYLGVEVTSDLRNAVRDIAPTISNALLNR